MNPAIQVEYDNTIGHYLNSGRRFPIWSVGIEHWNNNHTSNVTIAFDYTDRANFADLKLAILDFIKPHLAPHETIRVWLSVRNQRASIQAQCSPNFQHPELLNNNLVERLTFLVQKIEEKKKIIASQ